MIHQFMFQMCLKNIKWMTFENILYASKNFNNFLNIFEFLKHDIYINIFINIAINAVLSDTLKVLKKSKTLFFQIKITLPSFKLKY